MLWHFQNTKLYRTQGEYDTMNRQHVRLIRDLFIDFQENGLSYTQSPRMLAIYSACASARLRERCIVPINVPCMLHLYVHVWVRHRCQEFTTRMAEFHSECGTEIAVSRSAMHRRRRGERGYNFRNPFYAYGHGPRRVVKTACGRKLRW